VLLLTTTLWWVLARPARDRVLAASAPAPPRVRPDFSTAAVAVLAATLPSLVMGRPAPAAAAVTGVFAATAGQQSVIDFHTRRLPLAISHRTAGAIVVVAALSGGMVTAGATVIGGVAMALIAQLLAVVSRGSLGRGDVHYCLPLGAALGFFSGVGSVLQAVVLAWALTAAAAGCVIGVGLARRTLTRRSTVAYGPFLTLGSVVALCAAIAA